MQWVSHSIAHDLFYYITTSIILSSQDSILAEWHDPSSLALSDIDVSLL